MLTVTVWEDGDGNQQFAVHKVHDDGVTTEDVSERYMVHPMAIEDEDGTTFIGFHVGLAITPDQVLSKEGGD